MTIQKKFFSKNDMILILILLVIGGIFMMYQRNRPAGTQVLIKSDNEVVASFPLAEDHVYTVTNELGTNTVIIEHGQAYVTDADCPDKICEQMGAISKPGETIVCLPHLLVVEVSDAH